MDKNILGTSGAGIFLFFFYVSSGQINVSAGPTLAYPELITNHKILNSGQISAGLRVAAAWQKEDLVLFPGIEASYGGVRLPLQSSGNNVAALNMRYASLMINEYFTPDNMNRLLLYGGIGGTYMRSKGAAPSGNETRETTIDSTANITHFFPAINLGVEYTAYTTGNWSVIAGLCLKYTALLAGQNTYYITVSKPGNKIYDYTSSLTGNLVTPGLYLSVHYKIGGEK